MSAPRIEARYPGTCRACSLPVEIGELIVYMPPRPKRRRGLVFHDECAREHGQNRRRGRPDAWKSAAEWLSAADFAVVEDAMSRQAI